MTLPTATAESFHQIVDSRRSIREFLPDPVPDEILDRCLNSALKAASSGNLQPWEFVIIREGDARKEAILVCHNQRGPKSAPLLLAVVAHHDSWERHCRFILDTLETRGILRESQMRYWGLLTALRYSAGPFGLFGLLKGLLSRIISVFRPAHNLLTRSDRRVVAHKSTALAAATFMLAVRAEGFDTCAIEGFDPWRAKRLLNLSRGGEVTMFLAVGKRADAGIWWDRILVPREWVVREV